MMIVTKQERYVEGKQCNASFFSNIILQSIYLFLFARNLIFFKKNLLYCNFLKKNFLL